MKSEERKQDSDRNRVYYTKCIADKDSEQAETETRIETREPRKLKRAETRNDDNIYRRD